MARPAVSDWEDVFGFSDDPTPGDTEVLGQLARSYRSVADNAGDALPLVSGLENQQVGEGKTMEKLRDKLGDLAEQVRKLHSSYDQAAGALDTYVHSLRDQQRNADNALEKGREAKERLASATEAVRAAGATIGQLDAVDHPPDDIEARASTRRAMDEAKSSQSTAQGHADDAQADLDAARLLAEDARQVREEDAATAAQKLDDARDESVAGYSLWDKIKKAFSKALGIISAVLGVLALLIPGLQGLGIALTIGAVVAGAASLGINMSIMAETGDWDIGEIVLGVVGLVAGGGALLKGVGSIGSALKGVARNGLNKIGSAFRPNGRGAGIKKCATDPVDVATGEMLMIKTDLELHGVLPLRLTRTYLSTYRYGQFFGPSWASTLDERLEVDGRGRAFWAREDGSILSYPRLPEAGSVDDLVWPEEGARLPLAAEETAEGEVTYSVADPHTGVSSHFADRPTPGAEDDTRVHWLVRWHDRNGNEVRIEREEDGSPTAMVHSGGYRVEVNCVAGLLLDVAVATPDGPVEVMSYRHDADGNLSHVVNSSAQAMVFDYDDRNRITAWTDRNDSTYRYVYDDANRVTETIGPEGYLSSQWSYDPAEQRNHFTDACGATTTYQLNDLYQVVAETDPLGHTVHTEWDRYDHLLSRTDALGHTTRYEYDQCHNLTVVRLPDGKSSTTAYNRLNQPTVQTQPDGSVWRQEFDERGNLTSLTAPDGTTHHLTRHPTGATATATDPSGGLVRFEADAAGLTVGVDSGSGGTATAERDAFGRLIALTDPFGAVTRTEWTAEGRLARSIAPDGRVKRMSWDGEGNCLSATDSAGGATRYEYTHFDLLAARTGPDGVRYTFAYDAERRLTQVRNPQGLTWDYAYDAAGRLTSESDFDGREVTYTHDASGRLLARTTPLGEEISFQYNSVDEILLKNVAGTTTSYEYDQAGSLVRMASPDSTLEFERDAMGRVLAETVDGRRTGFTYDVLGRRTSRTTPTGAVTELTYDELGNRDSLTVDGHRMAFTHDVLGKEMARVWGSRTSPVEATSDWDPAGRPIAQRLATSAGTLRERTYTYRADDHLAAVTDATTGLSRQMELDQVGRPLAVTADGWTESYAYDQAGNQTSATWPEKAGRAEARGERTYTGTRIQAAGAVRYEYDAAGRMVLRQKRRLSRKPDTWRYEWNAEDQLTSCVTPDGTRWRYTYDPLARRTAKYRMAEDGSVAEAVHFTWDETRLAEQTDTANGITLTWDHDDYRPLTQLERKPRTQEGYDSRFFSIVTDLVGTPTELVDEQGGIAWRSRATLWGVTSRNRDATATTPLRFPGQYQDPETGLHYNYFRHYDPETGRYVSPDPLGLDPAPNPVAYVSNPSTAYDPLGLEDCGHTAEIYILQSGGGYRPWPIRAEYTVRTPGSGEARTEAEATLPRNWAYGNVVHTEHRFSRMAGASTGNKVSIPNDPYHLRAPVARGEAVFMQGTRSPCSSCKGAMNRMANELGVNVRYAWSDKTWDAGGGMKWRE